MTSLRERPVPLSDLRAAVITDPRRIAIAELCGRLAVNRRTIGKWVEAGRFPAPHYLMGERRWWLHEIEAWEADPSHANVQLHKRLAVGGLVLA